MRMIRHYWVIKGEPKRRIIISRRNAYHGSTITAASMGGMSLMHSQLYPPYEGFRHVMEPYWYGNAEEGETPEAFGLRAAQAIEDEILAVGPENVAAFVGEPVMGAGGLKIPPSTYWPAVQKIVDKYGILFLHDEVITGFGRTGKWFGAEYYGTKPDLVTFAKAATSGYIPLSGLLVGDRVANAFAEHDDEFYHGYTYAGHPVACAVALKNIEIMQRERLVRWSMSSPGRRWLGCWASSKIIRSSGKCARSACSARSNLSRTSVRAGVSTIRAASAPSAATTSRARATSCARSATRW